MMSVEEIKRKEDDLPDPDQPSDLSLTGFYKFYNNLYYNLPWFLFLVIYCVPLIEFNITKYIKISRSIGEHWLYIKINY